LSRGDVVILWVCFLFLAGMILGSTWWIAVHR